MNGIIDLVDGKKMNCQRFCDNQKRSNVCLNVKIYCFSSSVMIVSEESVGLGLLDGQKKSFKDITLGNCDEHFSFFFYTKRLSS